MDEGLEVEEEEDDKDAIGSCRIRTAISIIKPGKGGMVIDSSTDGERRQLRISLEALADRRSDFSGATFDVDNVSFYDDEKLALDESYESDWKRRGLYFGPTFIDLDEELQQSFTDYLNERAIGSELAAM
jgi:complement component 1 Q subcomponent-binding protein